MILDVDLAQIEWRVCADLTNDEQMISDLWDKVDAHAHTCSDLMELPVTKENRHDAKTFNFRFIYADLDVAAYAYFMDYVMPPFGIRKWNNIVDGAAAKYHGMVDAHAEWVLEVMRTGMYSGPTGREWKFKRETVRRNRTEYQDYSKAKIYNYKVQGTSGDIIKLALVESMKKIKSRKIPIIFTNTVHDSLIFDGESYDACYDAGKLIIETFRAIPELVKKYFNWNMRVPIDGEAAIGETWATVKEIDI